MSSYMCPNLDCKYDKQPRNEGYCPECGTQMEKVGFKDAMRISNSKRDTPEGRAKKEEKRKQKEEEKEQKRIAKEEKVAQDRLEMLLFHDGTPDDGLKSSIEVDMLNLAGHESGTKWMRMGTLLSFNSTEQMIGAGFKAIIDQNKVLIKQNEQLLRELKKLNKE